MEGEIDMFIDCINLQKNTSRRMHLRLLYTCEGIALSAIDERGRGYNMNIDKEATEMPSEQRNKLIEIFIANDITCIDFGTRDIAIMSSDKDYVIAILNRIHAPLTTSYPMAHLLDIARKYISSSDTSSDILLK